MRKTRRMTRRKSKSGGFSPIRKFKKWRRTRKYPTVYSPHNKEDIQPTGSFYTKKPNSLNAEQNREILEKGLYRKPSFSASASASFSPPPPPPRKSTNHPFLKNEKMYLPIRRSNSKGRSNSHFGKSSEV